MSDTRRHHPVVPVTQRVDSIDEYGELRDALDQRLAVALKVLL